MAQFISMLNVVVIVAIVVTAGFWVGTPSAPQPVVDQAPLIAEIQQPGLVLVKFGADWCGPCRKFESELDALTSTRSDVSVIKIDIDQNRDLAAQYEVTSIPCLILFHNGQQVGRTVGYHSREELKIWIAAMK